MKTHTNQFGEIVNTVDNHKHPDNPNFMQSVNWTIWENLTGVYWLDIIWVRIVKLIFIYNKTKEGNYKTLLLILLNTFNHESTYFE